MSDSGTAFAHSLELTYKIFQDMVLGLGEDRCPVPAWEPEAVSCWADPGSSGLLHEDAGSMDKTEQNKKYLHEIQKLIEQEFFGKIVVSMEKGRIVFLKTEQTIKL